ncbi:transposase [Acidiphilium sp. PA]|uniref:transposase n=1 Tax=Acidiphilium sp. PA TaxID=2871705 RepID=UPI002243D8A5|nr:transposase [Acidiphilium sp. PA]MCW8309378.1 transposase [Acidiphilium sp. PA]
MGLRRETVEHPFGAIKQWMNQGAFLMRRLEHVRGEFSFTALAYNIRRAITVVGAPGSPQRGYDSLKVDIFGVGGRKKRQSWPQRLTKPQPVSQWR